MRNPHKGAPGRPVIEKVGDMVFVDDALQLSDFKEGMEKRTDVEWDEIHKRFTAGVYKVPAGEVLCNAGRRRHSIDEYGHSCGMLGT